VVLGTSHQRARKRRLLAMNDWRRYWDSCGGSLRFAFLNPLASMACERCPSVVLLRSFFGTLENRLTRPVAILQRFIDRNAHPPRQQVVHQALLLLAEFGDESLLGRDLFGHRREPPHNCDLFGLVGDDE
jgi:hypothetical protein